MKRIWGELLKRRRWIGKASSLLRTCRADDGTVKDAESNVYDETDERIDGWMAR
jgi:hypothetical protein